MALGQLLQWSGYPIVVLLQEVEAQPARFVVHCLYWHTFTVPSSSSDDVAIPVRRDAQWPRGDAGPRNSDYRRLLRKPWTTRMDPTYVDGRLVPLEVQAATGLDQFPARHLRRILRWRARNSSTSWDRSRPNTSQFFRTDVHAPITLRTDGTFNHQRGCVFTRACNTLAAGDTPLNTLNGVLGSPKNRLRRHGRYCHKMALHVW